MPGQEIDFDQIDRRFEQIILLLEILFSSDTCLIGRAENLDQRERSSMYGSMPGKGLGMLISIALVPVMLLVIPRKETTVNGTKTLLNV